MMQHISLILFCFLTLVQTSKSVRPPNIIFIVADDLGWDDVSFHGSEQIPTPNIDALASTGVILNNYYVQPLCTPSRSAIMTGKYPIHTGLQHFVIDANQPYGLDLKEKIMPQYLKELGYSTHTIGKWHLGFFAKEYTPLYRGFETHYGYYQGRSDYWDHSYAHENRRDGWGLDFRDQMEVVRSAFGQYSTELFTQRAEEIIRNQTASSKPLYLYLAHQAVHAANSYVVLEAPLRYVERFSYIQDEGRRKYAAMLAVLDESIGNVTRALHDQGILNNTIIVLTTDNGGPLQGIDGNHACNWPLRGTKYTLWEGGTRGVGLIWSPLLPKSPYISEHMMHVSDWLPTLLHASGYDMGNLPPNLDGIDQWESLLQNGASNRKEILMNIDPLEDYAAAVRVGDLKLIKGKQFDGKHSGWYPPTGAVLNQHGAGRTGKASGSAFTVETAPSELFKTDLPKILSRYVSTNVRNNKPIVVQCGPINGTVTCDAEKAPCVFNITADPCEYDNLAPSQPHLVSTLLATYQKYNETMVPPRNKQPDPKGLPIHHRGVWEPWVNLTSC